MRLILDDATSPVDPSIEAQILVGLREELDTTLIVIAYRVSTIPLADRVLFLGGESWRPALTRSLMGDGLRGDGAGSSGR